MVSSPPDTNDSPSAFVCQCKDEYRSACLDLPPVYEHGGKKYCVLHYPDADDKTRLRSDEFRRVLEDKFGRGDFNFRGVRFPDDLDLRNRDVDFRTKLDCTGAVFNGEVVLSQQFYRGGVDFTEAEFLKDTYFTGAEFAEIPDGDPDRPRAAIFKETKFRALAYFREAVFHSSAIFEFATFGGDTDFTITTFKRWAYFGYTDCAGYMKFSADDSAQGFTDGAKLSFEFANIAQPERVSFNSVTLKPYWFIDVDPRKFDFANVTWKNEPVGEVLRTLQPAQTPASPPDAPAPQASPSTPHRRLATAYRQLAINAEENQRYGEASDFRYRAMDTRRRESGRGFAFWTLDWWYWLASGYGENIVQAFVILLYLWLLFAVPYRHVGFVRWEPKAATEAEAFDAAKMKRDAVGKSLEPGQAVAYSFGTMTLQRPEPRPATAWALFFVILETILGPVQAALLALAIRRKFMR